MSMYSYTKDVDDWLHRGRAIADRINGTCWEIGDWLNDGERRWGETYRWASEITGLTEATLHNYSAVARRFDFSLRNEKLSFGHHAVVVALPMGSAQKLLELAAQERWSIRELTAALKELPVPDEQPALKPADEPVVTVYRIKVAPKLEERWRMAADRLGMSVEDWLIQVADAAAQQVTASAA